MQDSNIPTKKKSITQFSEQVVILFSIVSTLLTLGWVLLFSRYGIDFSDEGFYLNWISNPFIYSVSVSQFGFIYHPIYELVNGNIAALRQINILFTFGLGWFLADTLLRTIFDEQLFIDLRRLTTSAGFATASLTFLWYWLPTPNYNSLAFQALMITAIGILLSEAKPTRSSIFGWFTIGVGGWLAFMAKPSTAAALSLCTTLYLYSSRKLILKLFLISCATALSLLIITALVIDGSVTVFINRLITGLEFARFLGGGHSISQMIRLDDFQLTNQATLIIFSIAGTALISTYCLQLKFASMQIVGAVIAATLFLYIVLNTLGIVSISIDTGTFQSLIVWSIPFSVLLLCVFTYKTKGFMQIPSAHWAMAILFLTFPHVYAFGTNNNYWSSGSLTGLFWILSAICLLKPAYQNPKLPKMLLPLSLATQVMTVAILGTSIEAPYRQPQSLRLNDEVTQVKKESSTLVLEKNFEGYMRKAKKIALQAGFEAKTPLIDLTGQSPTILYALDAQSIGQAWAVGGYPGSAKLASEALKLVSCKNLAKSWLLVEANGPRSISPHILSSFGADFSSHYTQVGSWYTAKGSGGYIEPREQQLYKPTQPNKTSYQNCLKTRESKLGG